MDIKSLLDKIKSLKDLRHAINEVKSLDKAQEPEPQEPQPKAAKANLKHLGVKHSNSGIMTHVIGIPGADWHYEISINMHNANQEKPAYSIQMVSNDEMKSQHPNVHDSINSAIKAIMHHFYNNKWDGK